MDDTTKGGSHRRERATRGAFYLWMAAYAAIVVAIVAVHAVGGNSVDPDTAQGRQITRAGAFLGPTIPVVQSDVNG
ncbi:hypothetical protein [Kaistia terrae]|uniref:Uncharacterized protein n=1 Tax=Kaistia terrae TaxID=537017 RepID=A0ABW0PRP7_9HYPH|nr:hypothetical protein [Kaistia terrae]MCX5578071.1 hypothetical protein [Kaistia terrae]